MNREVIVDPEAAAEIDRIDDWWRAHREKNPTRFARYLAAARILSR